MLNRYIHVSKTRTDLTRTINRIDLPSSITPLRSLSRQSVCIVLQTSDSVQCPARAVQHCRPAGCLHHPPLSAETQPPSLDVIRYYKTWTQGKRNSKYISNSNFILKKSEYHFDLSSHLNPFDFDRIPSPNPIIWLSYGAIYEHAASHLV